MKYLASFIILFAVCADPLYTQDAPSADLYDTVIFACSEPMPGLRKLFDEDLGRVFQVRNLGNVVAVGDLKPDHIEVASIEYAVTHGAKKVIVLGHKGCSVVRSVMDNPTGLGNQPAIYAVISKSITLAKREESSPEKIWQKAIEYNVKNTVDELLDNRFILSKLVADKSLEVVGAVYDPETGSVNYLGVK